MVAELYSLSVSYSLEPEGLQHIYERGATVYFAWR
jgi:hypothetical protein